MYIKKSLMILVVISLFLTFRPVRAAAGDPDNLTALYFGGRKVDSDVKLLYKDGVSYINLPFLNKYFNMVTAWNHGAGDLFLKYGSLSLKLYRNKPVYYRNGVAQTLNAAPFEQDQQFWLPLQFLLRLGLTITAQDNRQIALDWDQNYLLSVESSSYQGRPALVFITAQELTMHAIPSQPERLILEMPGVVLHPAFNAPPVLSSYIEKLAVDSARPGKLRLVLDLANPVAYLLIPDPEHANRVMLVFNSQINNIFLPRPGVERILAIQTSAPVTYQVSAATAPDRMILDLQGASLGDGGAFLNNSRGVVLRPAPEAVLAGDNKWVRQIKAKQLDPQTVRLEIEFFDQAPRFVVRALDNPNLIEVKTVQQIQRAVWSRADPASFSEVRLDIAADGEIWNTVRQNKDGDGLLIDLNYLQLAPAAILPAPPDRSLVAGIRWAVLSPSAVRLEIDAARRFIAYRTEMSPDRRRLTVRLRPSPLIGKTVVLDPGHGGEDEGACGRQGTREKENNLEIALQLKMLLEAAGATVYLTRDDDTFIGLYERSAIANYLTADLFISIHTNNHPDWNVHGIEVYTYPGRKAAVPLARDVLRDLVQKTGFPSLGLKEDNFVVIREAHMPGILIEVGYISNFNEEAAMRTPEFKENAAAGIYAGIVDYLWDDGNKSVPKKGINPK